MQFPVGLAGHGDGDGDGVDLVVVRPSGERAGFVDKIGIPCSAHEADAAFLGKGDPRQKSEVSLDSAIL